MDPVVVDDPPVVDVPLVGAFDPSIAAFRSANGIPRFWDTWTAAMNCPWLRKPEDAVLSVMSFGSIFSRRDPSGFPCNFRN